MAPDDKAAVKAAEGPDLTWLRRVVTGLAVAMGLGIVAIAAILWVRLAQPSLPRLPPQISLPPGAQVEALTFARDWTVVVTQDGDVLIYDAGGALRERARLK